MGCGGGRCGAMCLCRVNVMCSSMRGRDVYLYIMQCPSHMHACDVCYVYVFRCVMSCMHVMHACTHACMYCFICMSRNICMRVN